MGRHRAHVAAGPDPGTRPYTKAGASHGAQTPINTIRIDKETIYMETFIFLASFFDVFESTY